MKSRKLIIVAIVVAAVVAFFALDLRQYLSLDYFQASRQRFDAAYAANPAGVAAAFFALYVAVAALSIPGAAVLTLVAGALFGLVQGVVLVSFASAIGATLAFLASRWCCATGCRASSARASRRSTPASRRKARSTCSHCGWCRCSRSGSSTC